MAKTASDREWEAQDAANTLLRAEEIRSNRPLLASAQRELGKRQKAVEKAMRPQPKKRAPKKRVARRRRS